MLRQATPYSQLTTSIPNSLFPPNHLPIPHLAILIHFQALPINLQPLILPLALLLVRLTDWEEKQNSLNGLWDHAEEFRVEAVDVVVGPEVGWEA